MKAVYLKNNFKCSHYKAVTGSIGATLYIFFYSRIVMHFWAGEGGIHFGPKIPEIVLETALFLIAVISSDNFEYGSI